MQDRKPQDTGMDEETQRPGKKISGSGHFGVQVMQANRNLKMINEDKSNHFSRGFSLSETKEADSSRRLFGTTDNRARNDSNRAFQTKTSGTGNKVPLADFYEVCSISTMGNGSNFPHENKDKKLPAKPDTQVSLGTDANKDQPWVIKQCPNEPHYLTEFPPLYWMVKNCPGILEAIKKLYQIRWRASYPLQRRVFLSQQLRKAGIFCTYGELFLILLLGLLLIAGVLTTFVWPSVLYSGHAARIPLILTLATAMRNSLLTLFIGLPFERALWYHKMLGRITFCNGILHTVVAHAEAIQRMFFKFLIFDQMNASGTGLLVLITGVTITSLPQIRHCCFEVFYYIHLLFVALMTACAFYHSGIVIPVLAALVWGGDLFCRKVVMACCRYPKTARLRVISDTVVELSFPKTAAFDYSPLQHISVAVPELSIMEWHPFSIASCPRQPNVTLLIRDCGPFTWTNALYKLAKEKTEVSVLIEGPNGSPNVDVFSDRYKSYLLFSGGVGVTPCQAMCNQLVYDQSRGSRQLERIRFVWTERDPVVMESVEVVKRSSCHFEVPNVEDLDLRSIASNSVFNDGKSQTTDIASTLLSLVPPSRRTDAELEQDYPIPQGNMEQKKVINRKAANARPAREVKPSDESTFRGAFNNPTLQEILDMQVYLTSKEANLAMSNMPFVYSGRPDIEQIFADMREEALESGLDRVAVIVCAPARLAHVLRVACTKYSDSDLSFDLHVECQD